MDTDELRNHLLHQFRYTHYANRQVIDALDAFGPEALPERALTLLSHLLRAQDVWIGRVRGDASLPAIWETDTLAACRERNETSAEAWREFIHDAPDLTRVIHYENSKGVSYRNELREICGHVVDHATHHRAQVLALLRAAGGEPPVTGYVYWARDAATNPRRTPDAA